MWVRTLEKRKARHIYLTRQTSTLEWGEAEGKVWEGNHEVGAGPVSAQPES